LRWMYVLSCHLQAPVSIERAFSIFESPYNLARITPPWLRFRITTPEPVTIGKGAEIEYEIRWLRLPIRWKTIITAYDPPRSFEDRQAGGPYAYWLHRHGFEAVDGGTLVSDRVEYELPMGPLGRVAHSLAVGRQLRGIFEHRGARLVELLGGDPARYEFSPVVIVEK
jgi:ligand-binding SRPBCC domain-containing protein